MKFRGAGKSLMWLAATAGLVAASGHAVTLGSASAAPQATNATAPTFNTDVAPILFENCVSCHRPGEVAPMPLLSYQDARPWARAIKSRVVGRLMPPWGADPHYGKFSNGRGLTQAQIDTLAAWADAGAPEGTGALPPAPVFPEGSNGFMDRPPDRTIEMQVEIDVPASGAVPMFLMWNKEPFGEDRFIEAIEVRPSNRTVTHHSAVRAARLPAGMKIGTGHAWPGGPLLKDAILFPENSTEIPSFSAGAPDDELAMYFCCYVPGGGFNKYPAGTAKRLRPDDHLYWRLHYTPNGKPQKERHVVNLWFAKYPVKHEVMTLSGPDVEIAEGQELLSDSRTARRPNIPAAAANWRMDGVFSFPSAVTITALWPHMHWRGKDMKYIVTYPDGREEVVLNVPRYDFEWQFQYEFAAPLKLPAGSVMRVIAHYNNSQANRLNPAPNEDVIWGEQSWEEMFNPFVDLYVDDAVPALLKTQISRVR